MRKASITIGVFAVAALVGPLVRFLTWPPSKFEEATSATVSEFVYHLVILIWPTQPLAVVEASTGPLTAAAVAICGNVLLFSVMGLVVWVGAKRLYWLITSYVAVCGLVLLAAFWGAGFNVAFVNGFAFVVALLIYAIPFWVVARVAK